MSVFSGSDLRRRWKEIEKYNEFYSEESVKKNIIGIMGTTEDWKMQLSSFLEKLNLPFRDESTIETTEADGKIQKINLDLRGIDLSNERFTARKFNDFAYMKNSNSHISSIGDMSGLHLEYAILENVHFEGVDLSHSFFDFASMKNSTFKEAKCRKNSFVGIDAKGMLFEKTDMSGSSFIFSDMRMCEITESIMEGCDFTGTKLLHIKLSLNICDASTRFISQKTNFLQTNDGKVVTLRGRRALIGKNKEVLISPLIEQHSDFRLSTADYNVIRDEADAYSDEDIWSEIKEVYRQLKLMFRSFGFYSEADMYFFLELKAKRKSHTSVFYRIVMKIVEILTGYGIKIERMVFLALVNVLLFSFIYYFGSGYLVSADGASMFSGGEKIARSVYFSIVTFTTVGYGDIHPIGYMRFVANAEAFSGLLVMGLFVVSITRKFIGD
ncbi:MAG: ion channel [bacterium]